MMTTPRTFHTLFIPCVKIKDKWVGIRKRLRWVANFGAAEDNSKKRGSPSWIINMQGVESGLIKKENFHGNRRVNTGNVLLMGGDWILLVQVGICERVFFIGYKHLTHFKRVLKRSGKAIVIQRLAKSKCGEYSIDWPVGSRVTVRIACSHM